MSQEYPRIHDLESEIAACMNLLEQTDYKALKHADGALSDDEYAETKELRAEWRKTINERQAELEVICKEECPQ